MIDFRLEELNPRFLSSPVIHKRQPGVIAWLLIFLKFKNETNERW